MVWQNIWGVRKVFGWNVYGLITGLEPRADGAAHGLWFEMQPWVMFPPSESCAGLQLSAKAWELLSESCATKIVKLSS